LAPVTILIELEGGVRGAGATGEAGGAGGADEAGVGTASTGGGRPGIGSLNAAAVDFVVSNASPTLS
jgi:hypothetical protein